MKHPKSLLMKHKNWLAFLLTHGIIQMGIVFAKAKSQDRPFVTPTITTSLPCFSHCATCPVICSPPPALPEMSSASPLPPPTANPSPPSSFYFDHSPPAPPPPVNPSPPSSYYFDQSPLSSAAAFPPPPPGSSYVSWSKTPPAFSPPYNTAGQGLPQTGQRSYSFPYYYYNASKTSCISFDSVVLFMLLCLSCI